MSFRLYLKCANRSWLTVIKAGQRSVLKRPSKAACSLCSITYSSKWIATQRKSTSHTSFNVVGHVGQITCRLLRCSEMLCPSKRECLMAWDRSTTRGACKWVFRLQEVGRNHVEPMIASELPDYSWQNVASDQLFWKGKTYPLVVLSLHWSVYISK